MAVRPRPQRCRAVLPSGQQCCEPYDYTLFSHLDNLYSTRLKDAERSSDNQKIRCTLKDWVEDLRAVNKDLVEAVQKLEVEAEKKVSANHELSARIECFAKKSKNLSEELCRKDKQIKYLDEIVEKLKDQLEERQNRISEMMEDLTRWSSTNDCQECEAKIVNMQYCADKLKAELESNKQKLCKKEKQIEDLENEITKLQGNQGDFTCYEPSAKSFKGRKSEPEVKWKFSTRESKCNEVRELNGEFDEKSDEIDMSFENKCTSTPLPQQGLVQLNVEFDKEVEALKKLLKEQKALEEIKDREILQLKDKLCAFRMTTREMQEALTMEVAEKHDALLALRREIAQLEEQVRQSDMQIQFKDDIIKGLRKEVKIARAKESFVEMLGLNGNPRVRMKGEIDRLRAEVEERGAEVASLQAKLEESKNSKLEAQLTEISARLSERDRDLIAMCNKLDYVKRYIEKLHNDEDLSIKCGMEALLHELNEDSEWRRQARRSVTSLSEQPPESVIIINRSHSLPTDTSQGINHYQTGRGMTDSIIAASNAEVSRLNGCIAELEGALVEAREQICYLNRRIKEKEHELEAAHIKDNSTKWYTLPDASISTKFEDFQNSVDDSSRKMELVVTSMKDNDIGEMILCEVEECKRFLEKEKEKLDNINTNLCHLMAVIRSYKLPNNDKRDYKIECLEKKLYSLIKKVRRLSFEGTCYETPQETDETEKEEVYEDISSKLDEIMMGIRELRGVSSEPFKSDNSSDQISNDESTVIREIICDVKSSLTEVKKQESKFTSLSEMLKCESSTFKNRMMELSKLISSNAEDLCKIKQEMKIAICETSKAAEKVKKQSEKLACLEDTINAIHQLLSDSQFDNVCQNSASLKPDADELKPLFDTLVSSYKDIMTSNKSNGDVLQKCKKPPSSGPRQCLSTPQLGGDDSLPNPVEFNSFEDKVYIAQELCNEIKREFDTVNSRLNQKQFKMSEMSEKLTAIQKQLQCALERIDESYDLMHNNSGGGYCEALRLLEDVNRSLLRILQRLSCQLRSDQGELRNYENAVMISRRAVNSKMDELDCTLLDVSKMIGQLNNSCGIAQMDCSVGCTNDSTHQLSEEINQLRRMIKCQEQTIKEYEQQIGCMNSEMTRRDFAAFQEIEILTNEKEAAKAENEQVKLKLQAKNPAENNQKVQLLKCQVKELSDEIDSLKENAEDLQSQLSEKNYRLERQEKEICVLEEQLSEVQKTLAELENDTGQRKANNYVSAEADKENMKVELMNMKNILCHHEKNVNVLKEQLNQSISEKEDLKMKYCSEIRNTKEILSELQQTIRCKDRTIGELNETIRDGCEKFSTMMASQEEKFEIMQQQLESLSYEKRDLENKNCHLIEQMQYLEECVENSQNDQNSDLQKKIDKLERKLCFLIEEHKRDNNEIEKLKIALKKKTDHANCLQQEMERIEREGKQGNDSAQREQYLQNELRVKLQETLTMQDTIRLLNEELDDAKIKIERDSGLRVAARQAIAEKEEALMELGHAQKELATLTACYRELQDNLTTFRDEYDRENFDLSNENKCLAHQVNAYKEEIRRLESEIKKAEKMSFKSTMSEADLQKLLTEKDEEWACRYRMLCKEKLDLIEEIDSLKTEIKISDCKMMQREESCNNTKKKVLCIQHRLEQKEYDLNNLKYEVEQLESEKRDMTKTLREAYKKVDELKNYLCQIRTEKKELHKIINQLQSERACGLDSSKTLPAATCEESSRKSEKNRQTTSQVSSRTCDSSHKPHREKSPKCREDIAKDCPK